jgi:hypothetical protein
MMRRLLTIACSCVMLTACATTSVDTSGTIIVQGTVQAVAGIDGCYMMESGKKVSEKTFYQLLGDASMIKKCLEGPVTLRLRVDSTASGPCPVGVPATLVEIVER